MEIHQLEYFVTIVNEGSISAAARKLNLSQPPLSLQVRHLEEELGAVLFLRGARQITLTEEGRALYRYAVEILDLERSAAEDIRSMRNGSSAALRLGTISSCHCPELYSALRAVHKKTPGISFRIREGNTFELLDLLRKGRIELAVVREPFSGEGLQRLTIRTDRIVAAMTPQSADRLPGLPAGCRPDTPLSPDLPASESRSAIEGAGSLPVPEAWEAWQASGPAQVSSPPGTLSPSSPVAIRTLQDIPLIIYRRWEDIIRARFASHHIAPQVLCVCDDARTCLRWVREIPETAALVPASVLEEPSGLVMIPLDDDTPPTAMTLVWRSGHNLSPEARLLVQAFHPSSRT